MTELKALTKKCGLRGYSQLRKAELIELLQGNEPEVPTPQQASTWEPEHEQPEPLMK